MPAKLPRTYPPRSEARRGRDFLLAQSPFCARPSQLESGTVAEDCAKFFRWLLAGMDISHCHAFNIGRRSGDGSDYMACCPQDSVPHVLAWSRDASRSGARWFANTLLDPVMRAQGAGGFSISARTHPWQ